MAGVEEEEGGRGGGDLREEERGVKGAVIFELEIRLIYQRQGGT